MMCTYAKNYNYVDAINWGYNITYIRGFIATSSDRDDVQLDMLYFIRVKESN
jgi:hypothetical protein